MVDFGEYIKILSPDHLIYIFGLIFFSLLFFSNLRRVQANRARLSLFILAISIFQQFLLYSAYFYLLDFDLAESLPFHISRINTILGIIYLMTKSEKLFPVMSYFSLYAWTSFLYPSRVYGIIHPLGISFFINHVITILLPFYGMLAYHARLSAKAKRKAFGWFIVYLAGVIVINSFVDGNYFYLKHKPFLSGLPQALYLTLVLAVTYLLFSLGEASFKSYQRWLESKGLTVESTGN